MGQAEKGMKRRGFLKAAMSRFLWIGGGLLLTYPIFSFVTFRKTRKKQVVFSAQEQTSGVRYKEGVYLVKDGEADRAFSARCPHLGCRFNFDPVTEKFRCPCHGSVFDLKGKRLAGPAQKGLHEAPLVKDKNGDLLATITL